MKPLELVNYGPFKEGPNGSHIFHGPRKRLTDAELAAEYWAAHYSVENLERTTRTFPWSEISHAQTFQRFATHPHYDEADQ